MTEILFKVTFNLDEDKVSKAFTSIAKRMHDQVDNKVVTHIHVKRNENILEFTYFTVGDVLDNTIKATSITQHLLSSAGIDTHDVKDIYYISRRNDEHPDL